MSSQDDSVKKSVSPMLPVDHTGQSRRSIIPAGLTRFTDGPLPSQPDWLAYEDGVVTVLARSPEITFTLNGTNTYLVGTGASRLLIDTCEGTAKYTKYFVAQLDHVMKQLGIENIAAILLTHGHFDHIGGVKAVREHFGQDIPVWKWPSADTEIRAWKHWMEAATMPQMWVSKLWLEDECGYRHITDGQEFSVEGATIKALYTPGHATDHCVFWNEATGACFSGDHVLGWGTTWVDDLHAYMHSLRRIMALSSAVIYPAHGNAIYDVPTRLQRYWDHRMAREELVSSALARNADMSFTLDALVEMIYGVGPEASARSQGAAQNITKILAKLEQDGCIHVTIDRQLLAEDDDDDADALAPSRGDIPLRPGAPDPTMKYKVFQWAPCSKTTQVAAVSKL
eukprot:m.36451 g.36451  ORF g.36451 m.36451 type:complete len:397 (+) comp14492_c0_seq2:352-1542(+)